MGPGEEWPDGEELLELSLGRWADLDQGKLEGTVSDESSGGSYCGA